MLERDGIRGSGGVIAMSQVWQVREVGKGLSNSVCSDNVLWVNVHITWLNGMKHVLSLEFLGVD